MRNDVGLRTAFDAAVRSDLALVGVGGMTESASIFVRRELSPDEIKELREAGAVGDINARFFDQSGQPVDTATKGTPASQSAPLIQIDPTRSRRGCRAI